jgi:uncharacterized membrane protein
MQADRDEIHLISRHSNWPETSVEQALTSNVYPSATAWLKFARIFFLSLGISFSVSGIVFFFAYNWQDLHKFVKLGLVEGLIVAVTLSAVLPRLSPLFKNLLLTGASVLVGVLFAVFGQIYQTGANAYDFFLGWTVFVSIWVLAAGFAPLWLIYVILVNTTLVLYAGQVAHDWSAVFICTLLFLLNGLVLAAAGLLPKYRAEFKVPYWFVQVIALICVSFSTIGMAIGILGEYQSSFLALLPLTLLAYATGIWYGLKEKKMVYLSTIPFSVIIIICAWLISKTDGSSMFLFTSMFVVASVTVVIIKLLELQKKWANE